MSNALPKDCKRLQGGPAICIDPPRWSIKRPASYAPVCEQAADPPQDGVPCDRLRLHVLLPADLGQIEQILIDRGNFVPVEIEVALEVCGEAANHPFQEYYGYCTKDGDRVSGFIVFGLIPMTDRCWDLYWIAVAPSFAREGVGQRLAQYMEKIITELKGRQIHIDTSSLPSYLPACRFYEKIGFSLEARLKDFYRAGDDKLIYVKVLGG